MLGSFGIIGRIVAKRAAGDWLILLTATGTMLIGLVQLAAAPIYNDAVTDASLRRILDDASGADTTIGVEVQLGAGQYGLVDRLITSRLDRATGQTGSELHRRIRSPSYALPTDPADPGGAGAGAGAKTDLTVLAHIEAIGQHATITSGSWPDQGAVSGSVLPAAVETSVAEQLGLTVGDTMTITATRTGSPIAVTVVGTYRIDDGTDRFWGDDELLVRGVSDGRSFRTIGPLVVPRDALLATVGGRLQAVWHDQPSLDRLELSQLDALGQRITALEADVNDDIASSDTRGIGLISTAEVDTGLPRLLTETSRSLTVTRSGVYAVVLQLGLLAAFAIGISGWTMVELRRGQTSLLQARGAGRRQLIGLSLVEAVLTVAPAALIAPSVAGWVVGRLDRIGPLSAIGLSLRPMVGAASYLTVAVAAVVMVGIVTWPAVLASRAAVPSLTRRRRSGAMAMANRFGLDVALVLITGLAVWQLHDLGPDRAGLVGGGFSVDPILVAAPTVALLAGAVLTLRVVPLTARLGEWLAARGRSMPTALTGWQLARSPGGQTRSIFLLVMAFAIGVFAASYSATWARSQDDQATHQIGADIRVDPNRRIDDSITDLHLTEVHERIDGVTASMPMARTSINLPGSDRGGRLLLLDSARAGRVVLAREDIAPDLANLMETMHRGRPEPAKLPIPGRPTMLSLTVDAHEVPVPIDPPPEAADQPEEQLEEEKNEEQDDEGFLPLVFIGQVVLVVQDGNGLVHRLDAGTVSANTGRQQLTVPLTADLADRTTAVPAYPLSLLDIEVRNPIGPPPNREITVEIGPLTTGSGQDDVEVSLEDSPSGWEVLLATTTGLQPVQSTVFGPPSGDGSLQLDIQTGQSTQTGLNIVSIRPRSTESQSTESPSPGPVAVPVVVNRAWLEDSRTELGQVVRIPSLPLGDAEVEIIGVIDGFPTVSGGPSTDPAEAEDIILVDLPTAQLLDRAPGQRVIEVDQHWLALTDPARTAAVSSVLAGPTIDSVVVAARTTRRDQLSTDPAALSTIGAFTIGYGAAALFAVVAFTVAAVMSARERRGEFTLLRALGLSPAGLSRWMATEQLVLLALGLTIGTALGLALSALVIPLLSIGQQGEPVVPSALPVYPGITIASIELVPVLVLLVVIRLLIRRLGQQSMVDQLRAGDHD